MLWGLRPVEAQATYGLAVDKIRRQIHMGLLLPEEKLPAERQLSDRFGISRVSLREALRVLEANGYITVRRGAQGGAFVVDEAGVAELARRRITREPATAMRVLEFLCANELAVAGFAPQRRGLPELKRMREACELMRKAKTLPLLRQAESLFHLAIAEASHNVLLARAVEDGLTELFLLYEDETVADLRDQVRSHHEGLLAAVTSGHPEDAQSSMADIHTIYWSRIRRITRRAATMQGQPAA